MSDELTPFEKHLEDVVLETHVAIAIHAVTHPGCTDVAHLTPLDKARAKAAITAIHDNQEPLQ